MTGADRSPLETRDRGLGESPLPRSTPLALAAGAGGGTSTAGIRPTITASRTPTLLTIAAVLLALAGSTPAHAQDDEPPASPAPQQAQLPPGHPAPQQPQQAQLPPGHPAPQSPQQAQLPPGHPAPPPQQAQLPPGHPPPITANPPDPHPEHHEEQPPGTPPLSPGQAPSQPPSGLPAGHPSVPGAMPGGTPQSAGPNAAMARAMRPPALATAEPSAEVAVGTIRVTVVDPEGQPVADAAVDVGSLAQGERDRWNERTDASGVAVFEDMPTGTQQAYRVNVPVDGATYSTTPFQLPTDHGFDVRVVRLPVTHDPRYVFFQTFRVIVEQRGERMHIIQQTELTNAGSETYVFPSAGERVELPEDATAFQFQRVMTDQRVDEVAGEDDSALLMRGSLPPGTVRLAYAYDLPIGDEDMAVPVDIPFPVFGLQVLGEAIPGLTMDVAGMSGEQKLDDQGRPCESSQLDPTCAWVLTRRRTPDQPAIESITINLRGIPGPSPVRWIAVFFALVFVGGGAFFALRKKDPAEQTQRARTRRRLQLLREARELEEELDAGEVGPEFHKKRRETIVRELATLLAAGDDTRAAEATESTDVHAEATDDDRSSDSMATGLALGLLLGLIGLAIVGFGKFGPEAKRGAVMGFGIQVLIGFIFRLAVGF